MDKAISNLTVPLGEMKDQVMVCIFILDNGFHKEYTASKAKF